MSDIEQHYGLTMLLEQNQDLLLQHVERIHQLELNLRLLAAAVLETHNLPEEWQTACQCSACKVAREVMGGLV